MSNIKAIGLDMDYTLAQYKPEAFESLAHAETLLKLVHSLGYPKALLTLDFDWQYMVRGLTIDKARGNTLKIDRHKYVKQAHHGFKPLSREERIATYTHRNTRDSFDAPDYAMVDTLFSLAESYLFMSIVELKDSGLHPELNDRTYASIYKDVRAAVDLCHRDGCLKRAVAADPAKYIHKDPMLPGVLRMLGESGFQLFLATNSLYDYTHVVMNHLLCDGSAGEDKTDDWLTYFEVVMVGCGKPGFFEAGKPLYQVHTPTGMLKNTDAGAPIIPIDMEDLPSLQSSSSAHELGPAQRSEEVKAEVYQGGTYVDLHKLLGIDSGSQVLYVGDHVYGDILRSKKTLGWRTMLVLPELEAEMTLLNRRRGKILELQALRKQREGLEDRIHRMRFELRHCEGMSEAAVAEMAAVAKNLEAQGEEVRHRHDAMLREHHEAFHPVWGQLLKTGYQNSRFAQQVDRFACLYTSHVSNLGLVNPRKLYRGRLDRMSHEEVYDTLPEVD